MKKFIFSIFPIAAIFCSFDSFAGSVNCDSGYRQQLSDGIKLAKTNQSLLAVIKLSNLASNSCGLSDQATARYWYARSLAKLGENELALDELFAVQKMLLSTDSFITASQVIIEMDMNVASPRSTLLGEALVKAWNSRFDENLFDEAIRSEALDSAEREQLRALFPRTVNEKSPWIAGAASALLPGLGQAYNGQYQTAAIAFVLNGVFLLSTIELVKKKMGFTAMVSGLAFSTVYVGNVISAAKGAQAINRNLAVSASSDLRSGIIELTIQRF